MDMERGRGGADGRARRSRAWHGMGKGRTDLVDCEPRGLVVLEAPLQFAGAGFG